jgi:hypothetical protein
VNSVSWGGLLVEQIYCLQGIRCDPDCLEQSARQLCFNKRHEKTFPWMPFIPLRLSICDAGACSYSLFDSDHFRLADSNPAYRHSCTYSHIGIYTDTPAAAFYE